LLQKAEEEDMSDDEESYELVDSLPRTKALTPHDMAVLEGQNVSVTNLNDRFEFNTAWSYDEVALALAQHLSIIFQYLDTLQPEAYSNDEEGENSEYEFKSPFVLLIKSRNDMAMFPMHHIQLASTYSQLPSIRKLAPKPTSFSVYNIIYSNILLMAYQYLYLATRKKIPRAILRSWCKNKFIMEAPPPPPKQDINSDANKPGPSGSNSVVRNISIGKKRR
jgi:hypothetical protein